ncbi:DUF4150 domain-containing protein, partial [Salmonella enterica subsp. houtenae]|nr:DUF4150 domain-containing protein [Salmonella enterica]ECI5130185.1 DUF4150 domain-containing protein [Salmonella enterica subsp. houtenae]
PVAYENEAYSSDLVKGTTSIFADGGNMIANMGSQFARSVLDEAGSMGGVISGTNKAETEWISHSFDVFFEGKPACRLTDKLFMNHRNTMNMAGLMQDYLPPLPEQEDESYIPPWRDDGNDEDKKPTMPCIVILVHGVNDVGEAYQNQDEGICKGLNTRLGRTDLNPHTWPAETFMISDVDGNIASSPVIPFYWGYKPVDHAAWEADQRRYRADLKEKHNDADLPYDTYREFDEKKIAAHAGEHIDNLNNWLDASCAKGGGTFANATTNIPDMFGPGTAGKLLEAVGLINSRNDIMNDGDWSHPIYQNPHRIYQAYAARRLADLILTIRRNPDTESDTINIVAHSQGTIITMLANMWVVKEGGLPADCLILNHSPYSLENRLLEDAMPGNQQTDVARQKTLAHLCKLMAKDRPNQDGDLHHDEAYIQNLKDNGCLADKATWDDPHYNRNNFGMVYNYFCPNDGVVSMTPVQGFGWRGIPDDISETSGDNLSQRVFCKGQKVGEETGYHFEMPAHQAGDSKDTGYSYRDVTINAPLLPEPFEFKLMAQERGYKDRLSGNDPAIARAAMKAERFVPEVVNAPDSIQFQNLRDGQPLNSAQLDELRLKYPLWDIMSGAYSYQKLIAVYRRMTDAELDKAVQIETSYSQHSSIVASVEVSEKSTAYDLAIGPCKAFENKGFWKKLLLRADWRRPENPDPKAILYYQAGILPPDFKRFMNKPESPNAMPTGDLGVVNGYGSRIRVKDPFNYMPYPQPDINRIETNLQWPMPEPKDI